MTEPVLKSGSMITARASPNIALVKYWGRRPSEDHNLPMNSSVSITLGSLHTTTSVLVKDSMSADRMFIDGRLEYVSYDSANEKSRYMKRMLDSMREIAGVTHRMLIVSENNFPASSGLASSASGAAALAYAVWRLGLEHKIGPDDLDRMVRDVSGSGCRSMYGGTVVWRKGKEEDGFDSKADCICTKEHWPELMDIIAIVDGSKKKISSSEGHTLTPATSTLYKARLEQAESAVDLVVDAILDRDLDKLAALVMRDSNNMHATMLDTYPPIMYLNDASREIMYAVHELNAREGTNVAGYTFDAGPNAHIITTDENAPKVRDMLVGISSVKRIIESHVGDNPMILSDSESLIDVQNLAPIRRSV